MTLRRLFLRLGTGAAIISVLAGCSDEQVAEARPAPAKVQIGAQTLRPQTVTLTAELPGRTSAHLVSDVRPRVGGIVRSRDFEEGSDVKAGDILYTLDSAPFESALKTAEAALRRANAAIPNAKARLDRYRDLTTRNAVSQQDLDDAQATMLQADADVAAASAAVETARINLEYTRIRAPIDGRIDASSVTPGALVTADQAVALATIRQLDLINVDVVQSSSNLLRLKKAIAANRVKTNGDFVTVELLLEDGSRYPSPGKLEFSDSSVSTTAGTVSIRAIFPNHDQLLMPGMYAARWSRKVSGKTASSCRNGPSRAMLAARPSQNSSMRTARSRNAWSMWIAISATTGLSMTGLQMATASSWTVCNEPRMARRLRSPPSASMSGRVPSSPSPQVISRRPNRPTPKASRPWLHASSRNRISTCRAFSSIGRSSPG
jgi:membrane fusion protein (multidrug efflux system)